MSFRDFNIISFLCHIFDRGSIGTVLLHTKVRDGASKAKIERQFRTLKETWLYTLDMDAITSLAQFDRLLKDYMRSYNTCVHSGIGTTPLERYQQTCASIRRPKSREWLEECFLNRITRKVNRDATASPGMGKSFALRCFAKSLNPNLHHMEYV